MAPNVTFFSAVSLAEAKDGADANVGLVIDHTLSYFVTVCSMAPKIECPPASFISMRI
jgi:hypothetical protein